MSRLVFAMMQSLDGYIEGPSGGLPPPARSCIPEPNGRVLATAFAVGATLLAMPISFVVLRNKPYFDQTRPY
jgi:hypothetical protein